MDFPKHNNIILLQITFILFLKLNTYTYKYTGALFIYTCDYFYICNRYTKRCKSRDIPRKMPFTLIYLQTLNKISIGTKKIQYKYKSVLKAIKEKIEIYV